MNNGVKTQITILAGFFLFFYVFFAFATSIYRDYRLESHIQKFKNDIEDLEALVYSKPADVEYFESLQFKDKYAKESLNLINPGESIIILPSGIEVVPEVVTEPARSHNVLGKTNPQQWWEYFFGQTLTL